MSVFVPAIHGPANLKTAVLNFWVAQKRKKQEKTSYQGIRYIPRVAYPSLPTLVNRIGPRHHILSITYITGAAPPRGKEAFLLTDEHPTFTSRWVGKKIKFIFFFPTGKKQN